MSWLSLATALLKLAGAIVGWLRDRDLIAAGEQKQLARDLAALAFRAGAVQELQARVDAMTDDEIDTELGPDFRD